MDANQLVDESMRLTNAARSARNSGDAAGCETALAELSDLLRDYFGTKAEEGSSQDETSVDTVPD